VDHINNHLSQNEHTRILVNLMFAVPDKKIICQLLESRSQRAT
jgi:hypothetical protein